MDNRFLKSNNKYNQFQNILNLFLRLFWIKFIPGKPLDCLNSITFRISLFFISMFRMCNELLGYMFTPNFKAPAYAQPTPQQSYLYQKYLPLRSVNQRNP